MTCWFGVGSCTCDRSRLWPAPNSQVSLSYATCRVARAHVAGALAAAVSSIDVIVPTAGRSPGGRRRCGRRVSDPLAASEARTPASAGTLEQPGWRLAPFHATSHLTRPLSGDDDRAAVSARLRSCSSRRVLSGDILAASGVQRTAVQRPPTLRLIKRVTHGDCVHTRVNVAIIRLGLVS